MQTTLSQILTAAHKQAWNDSVASSPWSTILQFWEWGELKKSEGWQPERFAVIEEGELKIGAQALLKKAPFLGNYLYIPHGPFFKNKTDLKKYFPTLVTEIKKFAYANKCFAIEFEPLLGYLPVNEENVEVKENLKHYLDNEIKQIFLEAGLQNTKRNMQPKYKLFYDLDLSEDELLSLMKKSTRYNVRLAQKKGVSVNEYTPQSAEIAAKIEEFYALLVEMQQRAKGYPIRPKKSFSSLFEEFKNIPSTISLFEARFSGDLICMNISQRSGFWSSSFYAGSNRLHNEVKAPYLLRWVSVLKAKASGAKVYDFWGIIPGDKEHKGYSDTKLSFGGTRIDTYGILALPLNKYKYFIWDTLLPLRVKFYTLFRKLFKR